jgi:hypothetical protein
MPYIFPVEHGHILTFARAVGDPAASVPDGGAAATPPTFVVASAQFDPDYRLRPKPGQPWMGSGRAATSAPQAAASNRVLHGEQHFEYHRSVRVGQHLTVDTHEGDVTHKQGRSGLMTFRELISEYRDESGELIVTARSVRVEFEEDK